MPLPHKCDATYLKASAMPRSAQGHFSVDFSAGHSCFIRLAGTMTSRSGLGTVSIADRLVARLAPRGLLPGTLYAVFGAEAQRVAGIA